MWVSNYAFLAAIRRNRHHAPNRHPILVIKAVGNKVINSIQ